MQVEEPLATAPRGTLQNPRFSTLGSACRDVEPRLDYCRDIFSTRSTVSAICTPAICTIWGAEGNISEGGTAHRDEMYDG